MSFTNTIYAFSIFRPVSASMTTTTCYIPMWQLICIIAIPFLVIGATLVNIVKWTVNFTLSNVLMIQFFLFRGGIIIDAIGIANYEIWVLSFKYFNKSSRSAL